MATPALAASCFSRASNEAQSVEGPWGETGTAWPSQLEVDDIAADGAGLLVHISAQSRVAGRHRQSPNQGTDEKVKLWREQVEYLVSESGKTEKRG